jgi:membrane-associated phospholipid phosphatase
VFRKRAVQSRRSQSPARGGTGRTAALDSVSASAALKKGSAETIRTLGEASHLVSDTSQESIARAHFGIDAGLLPALWRLGQVQVNTSALALVLRTCGLVAAIWFFGLYHISPVERTPIVICLALVVLSTLGRGGTLGWLFMVAGMTEFLVLRASVHALGMPLHTGDLQWLETVVCFGVYPSYALQRLFFTPGSLGVVDHFASWVHWSYFFVPYLAMIGVWTWRPRQSAQLALLLVSTLFVGLVGYALLPATPPWLASAHQGLPHVWRIMELVGHSLNPAMYQHIYRSIGGPNPTAALPSLHFAITFMLVLFAWRSRRLWRVLAIAYSCAMAFALVYLGEHYVVDLILGAIVAGAVWIFLRSFFERLVERVPWWC